MNWRPEGWKNPYREVWDQENYDVHAAFEAGADAMLEASREEIGKGLLTDEEIGNSIDLETGYGFPCSSGSFVMTFDWPTNSQSPTSEDSHHVEGGLNGEATDNREPA